MDSTHLCSWWHEPEHQSLCFACKGLDVDSEEEVPLGSFSFNVRKAPLQTFLLEVGQGQHAREDACSLPLPVFPHACNWSPPEQQEWEFEPPFLCSSPFPLQNNHSRAFRYIKVLVKSNWGHPEYTCIYRVQVHGKVVEKMAI